MYCNVLLYCDLCTQVYVCIPEGPVVVPLWNYPSYHEWTFWRGLLGSPAVLCLSKRTTGVQGKLGAHPSPGVLQDTSRSARYAKKAPLSLSPCHVYIYKYMCIYIHTYTYTYIYMCVSCKGLSLGRRGGVTSIMYIYTHIHVQRKYIFTCVYIHTHMYLSLYIYICNMYIHIRIYHRHRWPLLGPVDLGAYSLIHWPRSTMSRGECVYAYVYVYACVCICRYITYNV